MGKCRYCGRSAGLFRKSHKRCEEAHRVAVNTIWDAFPRYFSGAGSADDLVQLVATTADIGNIQRKELYDLVLQCFENTAQIVTSGRRATADELARIDAAAERFGIKLSDAGDTKAILSKSKVLTALEEGRLPTVSVEGDNPLRLAKDEQIVWNFSGAALYEIKRHSRYVGGSRGVSVRVMKGVYYRVGAHQGHSVSEEHLELVARGDLTICSKNLYFLSGVKSVRLPLSKIVSVNLLSDGIEVFRDVASGKPTIFKIDDPHFAANVLARLQ